MDLGHIHYLLSSRHLDQYRMLKFSLFVLVLFFHEYSVFASDNQTLPSPITVPASDYWDGKWLPWSTFAMTIGTPAQAVRLLPSISGDAVWPLLSDICTPVNPARVNCSSEQGTLFSPNHSSSWTKIGTVELGMPEGTSLGYGDINADAGFDNITMMYISDGVSSPLVQPHQSIEGMLTADFDAGMFGLSPHPSNLSSSKNPSPNLLVSLKNDKKIPSLSWGYTAGASYKMMDQAFNGFGSLTLGGYDMSRFVANNVTFPFGSDLDRQFVAGLEGITSNLTSTVIFSDNIDVLFDSLVPDLWLPLHACERFAQVFEFQYDASENRYFVNFTVLDKLGPLSPRLSFKFKSSITGTVTISIPLEAFIYTSTGSQLGSINGSTVAIRQAQNVSHYTIGRVFLQEAYVIADYERLNFSLSQAIFPEVSAPQQIVATRPVNSPDTSSTPSPLQLSGAAIAAIVLGVTFFSLMTLGLFLFWKFKQQQKHQQKSREEDEDLQKPELDAKSNGRVEVAATPVERSHVELTESGLQEIESPVDGGPIPRLLSIAELGLPTPELECPRCGLRRASQISSQRHLEVR